LDEIWSLIIPYYIQDGGDNTDSMSN
jgi:hypothetical protein